jgi:hypothetical protein
VVNNGADKPRSVVMAVLLSAAVCPGAGQVYNRERGKGTALVAATLVACAALTGFIVRNVLRALPEDILSLDVAQVYDIVRQARSGIAVAFWGGALTLLWIYGIVDAYRVAARGSAAEPVSRISR